MGAWEPYCGPQFLGAAHYTQKLLPSVWSHDPGVIGINDEPEDTYKNTIY